MAVKFGRHMIQKTLISRHRDGNHLGPVPARLEAFELTDNPYSNSPAF
jgi:hypothetical protein